MRGPRRSHPCAGIWQRCVSKARRCWLLSKPSSPVNPSILRSKAPSVMGAGSGGRGGLCARAETGVERNTYLGARSLCLPVWNTRSGEHKRFDLKVRLILRTWQSQMNHFRGAAEEGGKFRPRPIHIIIVKLQDELGRTISYCKRHLDSGRTRTHVCSDRGQSHVF